VLAVALPLLKARPDAQPETIAPALEVPVGAAA
jgi:hypothetical protein